MVLCYLDETIAKDILHGPRVFVCSVDLNRTVKDTTRELHIISLEYQKVRHTFIPGFRVILLAKNIEGC